MLQQGQRVSEYILDAKLGAGAFGEVWRASHHVWQDQLVAIKIPTDPGYVRNLQSEGAAIHGLTHPNIVRAMGFDPYASPPYLVMEYVAGSSLRPLISERRVSIDDAVAIMKQVLAGLSYAHQNNIIHRDIKPENILVDQRALTEGFDSPGVVKVTDFGLGKAATHAAVGSIVYSQSLDDAAGRDIAGTLDYMSPEARTGQGDHRLDLYSCGVVFYELLTGHRPAGMEMPSDLNPNVPKYLDDIFKRAYARLEKRFTSADEMITALNLRVPPLIKPPQLVARTTPTPQPMQIPDGPHAMNPQGARHCPQCKHSVDAADQFCIHCGFQLVSQIKRCHKCGAFPDARDQYCIFCGETLNEKVNA